MFFLLKISVMMKPHNAEPNKVKGICHAMESIWGLKNAFTLKIKNQESGASKEYQVAIIRANAFLENLALPFVLHISM